MFVMLVTLFQEVCDTMVILRRYRGCVVMICRRYGGDMCVGDAVAIL